MANTYQVFDHIETFPGGREEVFEGMDPVFPYLAVRSDHDRYVEHAVTWHWHQEIEMFYVEGGEVDYLTAHEHVLLKAGDIGFVNANVLHATRAHNKQDGCSLLVHVFKPAFLADPTSRIYKNYIAPLLAATSIEICVVTPEDKGGKVLCNAMLRAFKTYEAATTGWELQLRDQLAELWLGFYKLVEGRIAEGPQRLPRPADERLKDMLSFVGEHYFEHIGVPEIAEAGFASERECHRTFKAELGVTPSQYLRDYRVEQACRMLVHTTRPLAQIGNQTGLGSPSHFGQVFREALGCTPRDYRKRWQNSDSLAN